MNDKKTIKLGISNWQVSNAYPPSDIIWGELQNIVDKEESWHEVTLPILNHSCSLLILLPVIYIDLYVFKTMVPVQLVMQYFCPILLAFFTLYFNPQLLLTLTNWELNERKSVKEQSFLSKLNFSLVFNMIFGPYLIAMLINSIVYRNDVHYTIMGSMLDLLQNMEGFYTRFIIQVSLLIFMNHLLTDYDKLVKGFEKIVRNNGKTKFEHWFYDLSFKSCMAVGLFTFGMLFSLIYPHIVVLVLLLFSMQFYIDKYNLMYIYPLDFESQAISRKTLVKNSFYGVIIFQLVMISIGSLKDDLLSSKAQVYLFSFVVIQFIILVIIFEFMRRPWEGVEIELEKVLELQ